MNIRVIVTETGAAVEVARVICCRDKRTLAQHVRRELRAIIQRVLDDNPDFRGECDMQEALKRGYWWADLGSEEFTVMVLEPNKPPETPEAPEAPEVKKARSVVNIDVEGGLITDVVAPKGVEVIVRDYDIEGMDEDRIKRDDEGRECVISRWKGGA